MRLFTFKTKEFAEESLKRVAEHPNCQVPLSFYSSLLYLSPFFYYSSPFFSSALFSSTSYSYQSVEELDLSDEEGVKGKFKDLDVVIHLAANRMKTTPFSSFFLLSSSFVLLPSSFSLFPSPVSLLPSSSSLF